jgi:Glutathione S-transferase, C-terminal domain
MTKMATFLEKRIQENGGCYIAGKSPSMADLALQGSVKMIQNGFWDHISPNFFGAFPGIM